MTDRLHPSTIAELERLVKLHGADALLAAIREIDKRLAGNEVKE